MKKTVFLVFVFLATVTFSHVSSAGELVCGKERDRVAFFNLYEEALKAEENAKFAEAICLFRASIERDPEKGKKRRARTYGMHFVENFDPNGHIEMLDKGSY